MSTPPIKEKYIGSPEELLRYWDEYKKSIDESPDIQETATGKGVFTIRVRKPYQRKGFERFVFRKYGFNVHQYIDNWNNAYESYLGVVTCMRSEWEEDQIEGTLTGRYKAPNLVARLNGLVEKSQADDKKEITINVKRGDRHNTQQPASGADTDQD